MELAFDTALIAASAAARFAGGRGIVLLIQARTITYPVYTPGTMSIMATYLGAVAVVAAASMKATTATQSGMMTCRYRSPVLSACHALRNAVMTASTYGGAVRHSDSMLPYPSVLSE